MSKWICEITKHPFGTDTYPSGYGNGCKCKQCVAARDERIADLQRQLADVKQRRFPIMDGPDVPWEVMAPHKSMCQRNQSVEELARRGGLTSGEAWCVVSGITYSLPSESQWQEWQDNWRQYAERINTHYERIADLQRQVEKLQEFKDYTHFRLDEMGIPTHPDGPHSRQGCRVGDRFDLVERQLAEAQAIDKIDAAIGKAEPAEGKK